MLKNILLFISLLLTIVNCSFKPPNHHNKHDNHKHKHNDNDFNQRINELEQKINNNIESNEKRFKLIETNIDSINNDLNKIKEKQRELERQEHIHNDNNKEEEENDLDNDDEFIKFKNETNQFHEMIQEQTNNLEDKLDNNFRKLSILIDTLANNISSLNKTDLKSGTCPKPSACAGINLSTCTHDSQCSGTKKCCSNGCLLRVCLEPVNKSSLSLPQQQQRECPNSTDLLGACLVTEEDMCLNDKDCNNKDELCCSFKCGKKCIKI